MRKYVCFLIVTLLCVIGLQFQRVRQLTRECATYKTNTRTLLEDVRSYRTADSLNALERGELRLSLSEYKKYRADDLALIKTLQVRNRDLAAVTTSQLETIKRIHGTVRDSLIYVSDTITEVMRCIDYADAYTELHGCDVGGAFDGTIISRDSLLIVETVRHKRFLGFLWKLKSIKDRKFDIVSRNPHTKITGFEIIRVEKNGAAIKGN